jgi:ArsR family transcriptional regulator
LFGDRFHLPRLPPSRTCSWVVGDLGCGTGTVSAALAPFVARVVAVDGSAPMLQAAKKRLQQFDNVDLRRGELESLPIDDGRLDAATLMLVLHHVPDPDRALAGGVAGSETWGTRRARRHAAARSRSYRQARMGHVWLGFSDEHDEAGLLTAWIRRTRGRFAAPDAKA